ncbi:chromate transporter [Tissierella sp. Yu-01]|uniref:chromate transporter n=1 Tax=Tissierella sp. Yu-01 TaxID=3035694 RepID=UPI00240D6D71|nr:chromate transporter [Tissierella sp. Yu-01]WFA07798.1 chromate transporter [Tissierella sp. Yu-01]
MRNSNKKTPQMMWEIFSVYFKAMLFAFTGGSVTLPILQQQLDDRYHLIDKDKVLEYFAVGQAMPGVISLNAGLMIGRDICGWPGALAAAFGTILPAFFGMLLVSITYSYINNLDWIKGAINGIRAASVAIIMSNAISIAKRGKFKWEFVLMIFSFTAVIFLNWSILTVILLSGSIGVLQVLYRKFRRAN